MPKGKKSESRVPPDLELKAHVLRDDALVLKFKEIQAKLHSSSDSWSQDDDKLAREAITIAKTIVKKYNIRWFGRDETLLVKRDWQDFIDDLARPSRIHNILNASTNWRASAFSSNPWNLKPKPGGTHNAFVNLFTSLPLLPERPTKKFPPVLTFKVDLTQVRRNNLSQLTAEFKRVVLQCLNEIPKSIKKPPSIQADNIKRDYERFRYHQKGMDFRLIALREGKHRMPSGFVQGESSVRESVERVHLVVFGKKYSARRHKTTLKNSSLKQVCDKFDCPQHGRDCVSPTTCTYASEFLKKIDPLLT